MRIFVTGACGQLGYDVLRELKKRGLEGIGSDIQPTCSLDCAYIQLDITDKQKTRDVLNRIAPDAVIHCAAWTNVDAAEETDNIPLVKKINVEGTGNIASTCKELGCKMMYISTDYVFNGQGTKPWAADSCDYQPLNVYGESKLQGEKEVTRLLEKYFIVRIAWVFGENGKNFVKTMLRLGKTMPEIKVVNDQVGTPTYTYDLARLLVDMILTEKYGYYHATNEGGYISWYDFACQIFKNAGYTTRVIPVSTEEYGVSRARRPYNSRLDKRKLTENGFVPLPSWEDALKRYLNGMKVVTDSKCDYSKKA